MIRHLKYCHLDNMGKILGIERKKKFFFKESDKDYKKRLLASYNENKKKEKRS